MVVRGEYQQHLNVAKTHREVGDMTLSEGHLSLYYFQRQSCNNHKAGADINSGQVGCDATGVGSVACLRNGFFVPEGSVDFQKGEQFSIQSESVWRGTHYDLGRRT
jgi:hypothetical protein